MFKVYYRIIFDARRLGEPYIVVFQVNIADTDRILKNLKRYQVMCTICNMNWNPQMKEYFVCVRMWTYGKRSTIQWFTPYLVCLRVYTGHKSRFLNCGFQWNFWQYFFLKEIFNMNIVQYIRLTWNKLQLEIGIVLFPQLEHVCTSNLQFHLFLVFHLREIFSIRQFHRKKCVFHFA